MSVQTFVGTLAIEFCYRCHVPFGIPQQWQDSLRESHATFYCPAGHGQHYNGKSDLEKAQERAARLERQVANREEDLRSERASHELTERRRRAAKGQLTKTKKRIANGVCPCCNRTFADLGRHMAGQHPDYAEASTS